ncbi:MAG: radical SAM protein [Negativicutes bacterium]|nr:radical SAM protein [Negativicutes bacterium]
MTDITFYVPGSRHYDNGLYANRRGSFVNISITGAECQCYCDHCQGQVLRHMLPAPNSAALVRLAEDLCKDGCCGVLVSGGAGRDGAVPLLPFGAALKKLGEMGLAVVVHPGLLTEETVDMLVKANVTGVALDLIGDPDTIREVYHLEHVPGDYRRSLRLARRAGLPVMPHIVVGLHYGRLRGEYAALDMVVAEGAANLIFVILDPLDGTKMKAVRPPAPAEIEQLFKAARRLLPELPLTLGCARPPGNFARVVERLAVNAGFNAIAYPARETVDYVQSIGGKVTYQQTCCGLIPAKS